MTKILYDAWMQAMESVRRRILQFEIDFAQTTVSTPAFFSTWFTMQLNLARQMKEWV